jgi:hypothetical protein
MINFVSAFVAGARSRPGEVECGRIQRPLLGHPAGRRRQDFPYSKALAFLSVSDQTARIAFHANAQAEPRIEPSCPPQ